MKTYTFNVTQDLSAYYEGKVSIQARSEASARKKLIRMRQDKLEDICFDWGQNTDNATSDGPIEIQSLDNVE